MGLVDDVRDRYEKHGLDAVWKWCMDGKGASGKAERFRAAAEFAGNRKGRADGDDTPWKKIQERYRDQAEHWHKRAQANDNDGGGGSGGTSLGAFSTSLGSPHWGGAADAMYALVYPIANQYGMPWEGDDKEYGHAAGGDHDPGVTNAFAEDFPTFSGAGFANAVSQRLDGTNSVGTYVGHYFTYQGVRFRAQVLWAVEGHFNHVHVGIRRA